MMTRRGPLGAEARKISSIYEGGRKKVFEVCRKVRPRRYRHDSCEDGPLLPMYTAWHMSELLVRS